MGIVLYSVSLRFEVWVISFYYYHWFVNSNSKHSFTQLPVTCYPYAFHSPILMISSIWISKYRKNCFRFGYCIFYLSAYIEFHVNLMITNGHVIDRLFFFSWRYKFWPFKSIDFNAFIFSNCVNIDWVLSSLILYEEPSAHIDSFQF